MNKILLTLSLISSSFFVHGQTILDFFKTAPDSAILGLSKEQRAKIANHSKDNKSYSDAMEDISTHGLMYAMDIVDVRNGFIRITEALEGHFEMCYWNLTNGNKLVSIYTQSCGPVCGMEQFIFYEYKNGTFHNKPLEEVIPNIRYDFITKEKERQMESEDIIATLLFELPQSGKNIIAKYGNEEGKEIYKHFAKGDCMVLKWNDGTFKKSEVYWE